MTRDPATGPGPAGANRGPAGPVRAGSGPAGTSRTDAGPALPGRDDPRQEAAWSRYNFAVHGWQTAVATVLIGPWMLALATSAVGRGGTLVAVGPLRLRAEAYPSAMVALAALVQLVALPGLGWTADARSTKRRWLAGVCGMGSAVCALLALTGGRRWLEAGLLFVAGNLLVGVSDFTWNGMLPELTAPARRHAVSSRATATGYLGAGLVSVLALAVIELHGVFGVSRSVAVRTCFVVAALWWAGFGLGAVRCLRPQPRLGVAAEPGGAAPAGGGTQVGRRTVRDEARAVAHLLRGMPQTRRYVIAYLCFADAMSAVIALSSTYLTHQLFHDDTARASTFLFALILFVQFVAAGGAVAAGRIAHRVGAKRTVLGALLVWCAAIVYAYAALHTEAQAVILGLVIGVALGATPALSRSLFASMIPAGAEASFFSLYEVCSSGTSWVAPLLFTVVVNLTGSFRQAILSLIVLFAAGLVLLARTDTDAAAQEAVTAERTLSAPRRRREPPTVGR